MKPQPEPDVTVHRKTLRELLVKSFSFEELQDLCFDYFPDVYDKIQEESFGKNVAVRQLINYCERRGFLKNLLALIQEHNAYQYSLHEASLFQPNSLPPSAEEQAQVTLKLTFPKWHIDNFTEDRQTVLVQLIAEELNIPEDDIDIVDVRAGSVIIIIRLPSPAARRLIALFYAGSAFVQDVGLGGVERVPAFLSLWQRFIRFLARLAGNSNVWLILVLVSTLLLGLAILPSTNSQGQSFAGPPRRFLTVTPAPATAIALSAPATAVAQPATATALPVASPPATAESGHTVNDEMPESGPTPLLEPTVTPTLVSPTPPPAETLPPTATSAPTATPTPSPSATPRPTLTRTPTATPDNPVESSAVVVGGPEVVTVGQLFSVAVRIEEIMPPGVFGAQFKLLYPAPHLEIVAVAPHPDLLVVKEMVDSRTGQLHFVASRHRDVPNFSQPVDFVMVTFRATAAIEGEVSIGLEDVKLGAKGGLPVSATIEPLVLFIEEAALR